MPEQPLLLITRPRMEAERVARMLEKQEVRSVVDPLLEYRSEEAGLTVVGAHMAAENIMPVVVTSRQAVRCLAEATECRAMPVVAVGAATAAQANTLGFADVCDASACTEAGEQAGTVPGLVAVVAARWPVGTGFLYPSAHDVRHDLPALLEAEGYSAEQVVCYQAQLASAFHQETVNMWSELTGVALYSRRTARHFVHLVRMQMAEQGAKHLQAFCLSQDVAAELEGEAFSAILVARQPDGEAMLRCMADAHV